MNKRVVLGVVLVVGLSMDLMSAPAKLHPRPMKPASPVTQTNAVVNKVAAPAPKAVATTTARKAAVPVVAAPMASKTAPPTDGSAGGVGLTMKVGTLGAGLEATVGANDYLGVRVGANMMNAGSTFERDEGDVEADLEWLTYAGLLDWHMFGGGFRVTGGCLINKNQLKLKANLTDSVELDGQEYYLSDLRGQVTFNELAPYVGFGYGNAVAKDGRWHFSCDFGVMFQGEPQVDAQATASDPALQPYVDEALSKEVADIQDDASAFKYYPVISVGVSYRF